MSSWDTFKDNASRLLQNSSPDADTAFERHPVSKPLRQTHRQIRRYIAQALALHKASLEPKWREAGCFNTFGRTSRMTFDEYVAEFSGNAAWGGTRRWP